VGLTSFISSGSVGMGASAQTDDPRNSPGWAVNAIGIYDDSVDLDYSSGSKYSRLGEYRHFLAAYDGISFSGSVVGNTCTLTAPSGSVKDLSEWKNDFYAAVYKGENMWYIARAVRGLEEVANTEGHWRFNGNVSDSTSNSHNLTPINLEDTDYIGGMTDIGKTSIYLPNHLVTKGAILPAADATSFDMGSGDFTIEAIVKIDPNVPGITGIVHKWNTSGAGYRLGIQYNSTNRSLIGKLRIQVGDGAAYPGYTGTIAINDGMWHYIALVVDRTGNTITSYVDGNFDKTGSIASVTGNISAATKDLEIGHCTASTQMIGAIDEICITKQTFSAQEIYDRHSAIRNRDMQWEEHQEFTVPLKSFYNGTERLVITTGDEGKLYYLDEDDDTWVVHTEEPQFPTVTGYGSGYELILPDPSGGYYGIHRDHIDHTDNLFDTAVYRYVYPPAISTLPTSGPTTIPGYRKQLDFLMDAAMAGSTHHGINRAIQGFTLITPQIQEDSPTHGWKLSSFSGAISQISDGVWKIYESANTPLRLDAWQGSYMTAWSGSTDATKTAVGYLVLNNTADNTLTVAPIHNQNLYWDLRRLSG